MGNLSSKYAQALIKKKQELTNQTDKKQEEIDI